MRRLRPLWSRADGITLVELLVGLLISALVGAALVTWVSSMIGAANHHRDDDRAVQDLRESHERLTRELRSATALLDASADHVVIWLDRDWDGEVDPGETITWAITANALERTIDDGEPLEVMTGLVGPSSTFTLDGESAQDTRVIGVVLVAALSDGLGTRSMVGEVFIRNAPAVGE